MTEPIQTTRMRRLPTVFGVFTTFSDDIPDVKRFAQVNWWKLLTLEGKCFCRRAKPAHIGGHLPAPGSNPAHLALDLRTVQPRLLSPVPLSPGLVSVHGHDARTVRTRPYVLCSSP